MLALKRIILSVALGCLLVAGLVTASAAADAPYYKGKTLTLMIGSNAGGGIDLLARPFAPVWTKHIPGNPNIIVKNLPGAGGLRMLNLLYSRRIKADGYTISFSPWRPMSRILGDPGVRHNIEDGHLIAAAGNIPMTIVASSLLPNNGLKKDSDVFKISKPIVVGGSRRDDAVSLLNRMSLYLSGIKYRYVFGYRGQNNIMTSLIQGETQSFPSLAPAYKQIVETNVVKAGLGIAAWVHTEFDLKGNPIEKFTLIPGIRPFHVVYRERFGKMPSGPVWEAYKWLSNLQYALPVAVWAPPGTPAHAVKILRESHAATVADPEHVPPVLRKAGVDLNWSKPEELAERFKKFRSITPEVLATIKQFIGEEAKRIPKKPKRKK